MAHLAIYNPSGCFGEFPDGNVGQVLTQDYTGIAWKGASGIAIADIGNFFTVDTVEGALQEIGERFSCDGIRDCVGDGLALGSGLSYSAPNIYFNASNLFNAADPLSSLARVVVIDSASGNTRGAQATLAQLATALGVIASNSGVSGNANNILTNGTDGRAYLAVNTVKDTAGAAASGQTGLTYDSVNHRLYVDGSKITDAVSPLPNTIRFLVHGDSSSPTVARATASQVGVLLGSGGGSGGYAGKRPWATETGVQQPTSADDVLTGDNIWHYGKVTIGSTGMDSINAQSELRRNVSIGGINNFTGAQNSMAVGFNHVVTGWGSLATGNSNQVNANYNFVGGQHNTISNAASNECAILGGSNHLIDRSTNDTIIGGIGNQILNLARRSTIAGGETNKIQGAIDSFIGGGQQNEVNLSSNFSGIVAGFQNKIDNNDNFSSLSGFIGAGAGNTLYYTQNCGIVAGFTNTVKGTNTGDQIQATMSSILAGQSNTIDTCDSSAILCGAANIITQANNSCAGGANARINHSGVFIWNGGGTGPFTSSAANQFNVGASGGVRIRTDTALTVGVDLAAGGNSWVSVSATALKGDFNKLDPRSVLSRLLKVPMQTYRFKRYKHDEEANALVEDGFHDQVNFGPTAEDWNGAFGDVLGEKTIKNIVDDQEVAIPAISEGDKMGVALASIQALASMVEELKQELTQVKHDLAQALKANKARPSTA